MLYSRTHQHKHEQDQKAGAKMIIKTPERQEAYEHRLRTYNKNNKGGYKPPP